MLANIDSFIDSYGKALGVTSYHSETVGGIAGFYWSGAWFLLWVPLVLFGLWFLGHLFYEVKELREIGK